MPLPVEIPVKRGRFATNLAANLGFLVFSVAIGVWLTPYLIGHLGEASYGIIPLATTVTGYMAVVTLALNSAVARFMTIALEQGDRDTANRYFNTSLFGSLFLALALVAPIGWCIFHIESLIDVPAGQLAQVRWLLVCTATVFLLMTIGTPFEVSTYCRNRFDLRNTLRVVEKLIYVGLLLVLFRLAEPQMRSVGLGMVAAASVAFLGVVAIWRLLTPELWISVSQVDRTALGNLLSMGGWVSFDTIGSILFLGIDLLIVNRLFGAHEGGRYAAVLQWSVLLRAVAGSVAGVFGPTVLYYYARQDIDGMVRYVRRAMKCLGLIVALPAGLVCGLAAPLLQTWLGADFVDLSWLLSLMTCHLAVNLAVVALTPVQTATNHVRVPAVVTFFTGAANLGLALLLAGPMGWGLYGVAAAGAIMMTIRFLLFIPLYTAYYLGCPRTTFLRESLPIIFATAAVALAGRAVAAEWEVSGWLRLGLTGTGISVLYAAFAYWGLLNADDRKTVWRLLRRPVAPIQQPAADPEQWGV